MKITSINFVKASDIPKSTKNTELSQVTAEIAENVRKAPAGQAVTVKLDSTKRWTSYALKRALSLRHRMECQIVNANGLLYIIQLTPEQVKARDKSERDRATAKK